MNAPRASNEVHFRMAPVAAPAAFALHVLATAEITVRPQSATIITDVAAPSTASPGSATDTKASTPGHGKSNVAVRALLPMLPVRLVALTGVALSIFLYGWQTGRVIDDQPRLEALAVGSFFAGAVGVIAVVFWTFAVVENARRVMDPARTQEPPRPGYAVRTLIVPVAFIVVASGVIAHLSRELNSPIKGTESSLPLILAVVSIFVLFALMYSPITYVSLVVRRIGGHGVRLAEWLWVPVVLAAVGGAMVFGRRAGGAFGEDSDALAPTWVVAVVALVPAVVVVLLGWRAAAAVETDVARAFKSRYSLDHKTTTRRFGTMFTEDGPNQAALRDRGRIRQIPGVRVIGFVVIAGLATLSMFSMAGAVVMFLFWQEIRGGTVLATENERTWDILALLQDVERSVAFVVLVVASVWTFAAVSNIRMASARRRNPIIAVVMWPATAAAVWAVADRLIVEGDAVRIIAGFAAQAILLSLPFAVLQRSAQAVNVRRNPILLTYAVGVLVFVHVQGLAGLSTLSETSEPAQAARLVGYFAIGALLQLVATFFAAEVTRSLSNAAENLAAHHNSQVDKRRSVEAPPQ
tara:strand:- start:1326 stop:3065 length:1740 start_codon:yes stop_codon:yes gene_type:complete